VRIPEQPTWTLMLTHHATIVHVRQEYADEKRKLGWLIVARESDLLPFNPPRLITDAPTTFNEEGA
jgi:hypothetical protein